MEDIFIVVGTDRDGKVICVKPFRDRNDARTFVKLCFQNAFNIAVGEGWGVETIDASLAPEYAWVAYGVSEFTWSVRKRMLE